MKARFVFALLTLALSAQSNGANRAVLPNELTTVQNQTLKTQELIVTPKAQFKNRIADVREVLGNYEFSQRSIREREVQIREFLVLASLAIDVDDDLISDEFLNSAYQEYRNDFDNVMKDISLGRYKNERLTPSDVAKIRASLADQNFVRKNGQDNRPKSK